VWQGPDVAYGVLPKHDEATAPNGSIVLLGVSVFMFGVDGFLDALQADKNKFFAIETNQGFTFEVDIFVARDAADIAEEFQKRTGGETKTLSGTVSWEGGGGVNNARVAIFRDENNDNQVDDRDSIASYADTDFDGNFTATIEPGKYLLRAEVFRKARSAAVSVDTTSADATANLSLQPPVEYDYRVVDDGDNDALIPARITVIGPEPVVADPRTHGLLDNYPGIVTTVIAKRGTSTNMGDGADPKIVVPPGNDYRILVSRGTEWSVGELPISPLPNETPAELELRLRRVVDTPEYVSSEYHVHSIGSPDSPVPNDRRVATAVADGVEFYATSDHDFVMEQQPIIEMLGLERLVRSIPGIEISPMVYGHFNAWPVQHDASSPNGGAVDWPFGAGGFAMTPAEIFDSAISKGAELLQVNHPRSAPGDPADITQHFDRLGLTFDYENRSFDGDFNEMPVPVEWLRLPPEEATLFDDGFNSLEVWNGFTTEDTNEDGVRELTKLDTVMRDWFNFLSFGKNVAPIGSSDTHDVVREHMGMPRTMVRVSDDSANAIAAGTNLTREILDVLSNKVATDVVVTDGPHIQVSVDGDAKPLGKVVDGSAGSISVTVDVQAADWAHFDTIEVFANLTPEVGAGNDVTALQPFACFTTRSNLMESDPCFLAGKGGADTLTVNRVDVGNGFERFESSITFSVAPSDITTRAGGQGQDAWLVIRVRGDRAIYPLFVGNLLSGQDVSTFVNGASPALEDLLNGRGRPATAFTSPIFIDFDGGGYRAPFAP
jgi:hypothetical protein